MKFEVVNDKNKTIMSTTSASCIYNKDILNSMSKVGYKFKLDGKLITVKKLDEKLKEISNVANNQD